MFFSAPPAGGETYKPLLSPSFPLPLPGPSGAVKCSSDFKNVNSSLIRVLRKKGCRPSWLAGCLARRLCHKCSSCAHKIIYQSKSGFIEPFQCGADFRLNMQLVSSVYYSLCTPRKALRLFYVITSLAWFCGTEFEVCGYTENCVIMTVLTISKEQTSPCT